VVVWLLKLELVVLSARPLYVCTELKYVLMMGVSLIIGCIA